MSRWTSRPSDGSGVALFATISIHVALAAGFGLAATGDDEVAVPVYEVSLVAAPRQPEPERRAPQTVERPAERRVQTTPTPERRAVQSPETPPPQATPEETEAAPRVTPPEPPAPDVEPSTGDDPGTVKVEGVRFPFPEYLENVVAQVYRRWQRPTGNQALRAEIMFFIRRDGSVTNLRFVERSSNFAFDLEAQGAIEAAATANAFGPLPEGYEADILPVSFFFDPEGIR